MAPENDWETVVLLGVARNGDSTTESTMTRIDLSIFSPETLLKMYSDGKQLLDDPMSGYDETHNNHQRQELNVFLNAITKQLHQYNLFIRHVPARWALVRKTKA